MSGFKETTQDLAYKYTPVDFVVLIARLLYNAYIDYFMIESGSSINFANINLHRTAIESFTNSFCSNQVDQISSDLNIDVVTSFLSSQFITLQCFLKRAFAIHPNNLNILSGLRDCRWVLKARMLNDLLLNFVRIKNNYFELLKTFYRKNNKPCGAQPIVDQCSNHYEEELFSKFNAQIKSIHFITHLIISNE